MIFIWVKIYNISPTVTVCPRSWTMEDSWTIYYSLKPFVVKSVRMTRRIKTSKDLSMLCVNFTYETFSLEWSPTSNFNSYDHRFHKMWPVTLKQSTAVSSLCRVKNKLPMLWLLYSFLNDCIGYQVFEVIRPEVTKTDFTWLSIYNLHPAIKQGVAMGW